MITSEPTLIVGLGGAGGQTIARLKSLVEQVAGEVAPPMSFLYADTEAFDALDVAITRALDREEDYLYLAGFNPREWIEAQFNGQGPEAEDVRDWYDTSARGFVPGELVTSGPSRLRMLGRIALFRHRFDAAELLRRKIGAVLARAAEIGPPLPEGASPRLRVILVSGTCGGTGSGAFLDVLYMLSRIAIADFHVEPETAAFLYLPDLFIRLNQRLSDINVPLYQANAWAFLDELDYFTKNPVALNDYAMDAGSEDRRAHPEGTGIPAGVELLHTTFLVDSTIPGVGVFERPRDLYAYTARAILQSQLVPPTGDGDTPSAAVRARMFERDAQRSRPKRYAAIGYAELAYPRSVYEAYLARRYEYEAIANGLLRGSPELAQRAKDDANAYAAQIMTELIEPSMAEIERITERALELLPTEATFFTEDEQVDLDRIHEAALRSEVEDTLRSLDRTVGAIRVRFIAERARIAQVLVDDLERRIDTGGEGLGLPYLLDFFAATGLALDGEHAKLTKDRSPEAYAQRFEDSKVRLLDPEGTVAGLAKAARSYFSREAAVRERLPGFVAAVRELVKTKLDGELLRCRVQLLRSISSDLDERDRIADAYDELTGELVATEPRSIIDRAEDTVIAVMNVHLSTLLAALHVDALGGRLLQVEGEELTKRFVVPVTSMEQLKADPFLDELFQKCSGLGPDEVAEEVVTLLSEASELGLRLSQLGFATYDAVRLGPLVAVLDQRSQARFTDATGRSVVAVLEGMPAEVRESMLASLAAASAPAISIDDAALDPVADPIAELRVLSGQKPEYAAHLGSPAFAVVDGAGGRIAAQRAIYGFPLYAVAGMGALQQAYRTRDRQRSFPHVHRRFNERGVPDSLATEPLGVTEGALVAFTRAIAVSEHLLAKEDLLQQLQPRLELVRDRRGNVAGFSLVEVGEHTGGSGLVLHMIDQDPEQPSRFRVHSPLEIASVDLSASLAGYARAEVYVQNHRRFLDSLEILEGELGVGLVRGAYEALVGRLAGALEEARAKKSPDRVRVILAMRRGLEGHLRALGARKG